MKLCLHSLCFFVCAATIYTESKAQHLDLELVLCSDSEREKMYGVDGEEKWHADFSLGKGVMTLLQFADPGSYGDSSYNIAVADINTCRILLDKSIKANNYPAIPKVAPQSSIYPKSSVQLGSKNTLLCHITGFYPPHVEVTWTRNNVNVTDEAIVSRYHYNPDETFNLISTLSFTPEEGDIYSCRVQHTALDRALTKTWDVQVSLPGVGASVFCGVGLAGGLLGVAVGTFFLIKGNKCN